MAGLGGSEKRGYLRTLLALGAVLLLLAGLNVLVWQQTLLSGAGLLCLGAALVLGVAWFATGLLEGDTPARLSGRAASSAGSVVGSVPFLGICLALYAFAQRPQLEIDLTPEGRRALAPQTIQVLESMTEEVEVLCYFLSSEDEVIRIAQDKTLRFLERCQTYTPLLRVRVLDPQMDPMGLQELGITRASQQGTVVLRAGERQRVVTLTGGSPRLEERAFTNNLINLLRTRAPKVGFMRGHGERDAVDNQGEDGVGLLSDFLTREAYECVQVSISLTDPRLPEGLDILVLPGFRGALHPVERQLIDAFMSEGGRLLVLFDPPSRLPPNFEQQLRPWLAQRFGIDVRRDLLVREEETAVFDVELQPSRAAFAQDPNFQDWLGAFSTEHPITRGALDAMLMSGVRSVAPLEELPEDVLVTPLLRTVPDFWSERDLAVLAQAGRVSQDADEPDGPHTVAVAAVQRLDPAAEGGPPRDARVVVVGNANFATNATITFPGHVNFLLNTFAWLSESEELIAIRPSGLEQAPLVLTETQERLITWTASLATLQAVLLAGGLMWWRRRREQ